MSTPPTDNLMRRLAGMNPTTAFLLALVVMLAGLFLPGIVGGAVLFALAALAAALTFTTWPVQTPATRVLRLVLLTLLIGVAISKIV